MQPSKPKAAAPTIRPVVLWNKGAFVGPKPPLAMADDVWVWCERTGTRGRTVTVKIKWTDFQQSTCSQSLASAVDSRAKLHDVSLGLIRSVLPAPGGVRLVGVNLSKLCAQNVPSRTWPVNSSSD